MRRRKATLSHAVSSPHGARASCVSIRLHSARAARKRPHAFTLVELLVVIAIIGGLIALLMPAIQASHEAAHAIACTNNLRQIAIAAQHHHAALQAFPTGGWDYWTPPAYLNGKPLSGDQQGAGWGFQILPYIEESTTWKGGGGGTDQDLSIRAIAAVSPIFFCVSRRGPQTITYSDPDYLGGLELKHALCDYAASNLEGTGAIRQYHGVAMREITDGASKTFLIGDKRLNIQHLGEWQEDDNEGYTAGWDEDTMRYTNQLPAPDHTGDDLSGNQLFGSSHHGGFNMSFVDGSVHKIDYNIDAQTFQNLGNKSDGGSVAAAGL